MANEEGSIFYDLWSKGNYHKLAVDHQIASERLVAETRVRAGQKVLDLAAGTGNTAVAAARRRARVTASDVVPHMLDVLRARAKVEELEGIEYHVGDSSPTIGFADESFDVVLSSFGASFFPNHQRVVDELLRVTRKGGTIGLTLWPDASLASDVFRAGQTLVNTTVIDKIQPAYQLSSGDYLRDKLKGRASSVRFVPETFEICYETVDEYADAHLKYHPPALVRLASFSKEQIAKYRQMLGDIALRYNRATDGTLAINMDYLIVVIVKA